MSKAPDHRVRALAHVADKLAKMGESATARRIQAEINRLRAGAEALDKVNSNRSPLDTEAAHVKKVATIARKFDQEVLATYSRLGQIMREGEKDLQSRIDGKVDLRPDAFAKEIRETFRTMHKKDRVSLLTQLAKENRGPELAAIVKAPAVLTGLSEHERARYETAILGAHAPAELAERAEIQAVFEESFAAAKFAGDFATSLTSPGQVAAIEQGEAAASAAVAAFDQSLQ